MWDESFSGVCVFISGGLLVRITSSLKIQIVKGVFLWNRRVSVGLIIKVTKISNNTKKGYSNTQLPCCFIRCVSVIAISLSHNPNIQCIFILMYWFTKVSTFLWIPPSFVLSPLVRNVWQIRVITQGITIIFPFTSEAFPVIFRSWERKLFVVIMCCVNEVRKIILLI